ncbi:MAG: autotransporter outer membrane beta-barrel domain-containing protein [Chlamydiae bacterium]|nr:autotransporter outer membrane beta-barrel domain-containing protein [Chlamydiota bacterium]
MSKSFIHPQKPWNQYGLLCCSLGSLLLSPQGSLAASEITSFTQINSSPPFLGFTSNTNSPGLQSDLTPNAAWFYDYSNLTGTSASVYFLQGATGGISASSELILDFQHSQYTNKFFSTSISTPNSAWAYDQNNHANAGADATGNVYYLKGSTNAITSSEPLSLTLGQNYNNEWQLTPTKVQGADTAWYYDSPGGQSAIPANIYYLTGSTEGITFLSATGISFQGGAPVLSLDTNPTAAWYADALLRANAPYNANIYYLDSTSTSMLTGSQTLTFQQENPHLVADHALNTAWYFDSATSNTYGSNVYYLAYDSGSSAILVGSGSATFSSYRCGLEPDATPNEAWFFDTYSSTTAMNVYYLTGSSTGPSLTVSASKTVNFTAPVNLIPDLQPHAAWYYVNEYGYFNSGEVYYLTYDSGTITASERITVDFDSYDQYLVTTAPGEAWYVEADSLLSTPYVGNAYYLKASADTISYQSAACTFNTLNISFTQDTLSNALWYYDQGNGYGTGAFNGSVYYLSPEEGGITASSTTLPFLSGSALLVSAGPDTAWYYDAGTGPGYNVYFLKADTASGWTSGTGGALSNSILNSSVAQARILQTQMKRSQNVSTQTTISQRIEQGSGVFLADADDKYHAPIETPSDTEKPYLFQVVPFYDFINQKQQGYLPAFTNSVVGALGTFDAKLGRYVVGGGLAYAYNHAHLKGGLGHANINQEIGVVYGSWKGNRVYVDLSCWGGFYQMKGERDFNGHLTSRYSTQGYVLTPHAELQVNAYSKGNWLSVDPFARADWVNTWQKGYTEKSPTGFDLSVPHQHSSLLRTEAGLYVEETLPIRSGQVILAQKASYINQLPFQNNVLSALFVGGGSPFSIASGTMSTQNLGGVEFQATFYPTSRKIPILGMDLQGEFGSKLQSYMVALELGKGF